MTFDSWQMMSSLNSRRRNHPPKSDTQIAPTAIFSKPPPAQCRQWPGRNGPKRQAEEPVPLIGVSDCTEARRRCLVNPELLGCHFGSGNAIGYLLKRDVTSVVE